MSNTRNVKMCCKVCKDAGKTEKEYSGHWVRDLTTGIVLCPYLNSLTCGYCFGKGHTPKHCAALAKEQKMKLRSERIAEANKVKEAKEVTIKRVEEKKRPGRGFFVLMSSSSDDEEEEVEEEASVSEEVPKAVTWADVTKREPVKVAPKVVKFVEASKQEMVAVAVAEREVGYYFNKYKGMSWADIEDSSSDEEDW